jgi:hypothetical protein
MPGFGSWKKADSDGLGVCGLRGLPPCIRIFHGARHTAASMCALQRDCPSLGLRLGIEGVP